MPRRKVNPYEKIRAWELYGQGLSTAAVLETLTEEFPEPISSSTVLRWANEFKADTKGLDLVFEWHLMDKFGLPWEAGEFLLRMMAMVEEFGIESCPGFKLPESTFRRALWWWRVHNADPSLSEQDIWFLAERFVLRERLNKVIGAQLYLADLEAHLAYKPWLNKPKCKRYLEAVAKERIPRILDGGKYLLYPIKDSGTNGGAVNGELAAVTEVILPAPELLPFKQIEAKARQIKEEQRTKGGRFG